MMRSSMRTWKSKGFSSCWLRSVRFPVLFGCGPTVDVLVELDLFLFAKLNGSHEWSVRVLYLIQWSTHRYTYSTRYGELYS
jgi:hypothetical protein